METKRRNFETALKKGELGEAIIRQYFESKGWVVYCPFTKDKPHYFDLLVTKNKEQVIAIDVKTKARLNKWSAQGINKTHYAQYMNFVEKTKVPFFLIFIDDKTGDVHAANIQNLKNAIYPNEHIIAWPLSEMKFLFKITNEQIMDLSKFDQRNYDFTPK
jgi:hypothetical protein